MTNTSKDILVEIREAAQAIGIAPTTLCQRAVRNGGLIRRLENGGSVTVATLAQIRQFIQENLPSASGSDDVSRETNEPKSDGCEAAE